MTAVLLTAHSLIVLALIGIVLLQRSEGGALGMGGGGGGFMTGRGAATALTRTTSVLAALFFLTSLALAMLADRGESEQNVLRDLTGAAPAADVEPGKPATTEDLLKTLGAGAEKEEPSSDLDARESTVGAPAPAEKAPPAAAPAPVEDAAAPPAETEDGAPPEDATPDESRP
ncbi:MAG: preprotein translocase subunit SecG [Amphiplicatus sp.]